jgi:hypothetical protein
MDIQADRIVVQLERRELLRLRADREILITCARGELWITQHGSLDDNVLGAGASIRLEKRSGPTVVQALRPARMSLEWRPHGDSNPGYRR